MSVRHAFRASAAVALALMAVVPAQAETFRCEAEDVACLIAAITAANANGHPNTLRLAAGTFTLTAIDNDTDGPAGLPSVLGDLTIQSEPKDAGVAIVRAAGAPAFRLLHVAAGARLRLVGVTLRNGDLGFTLGCGGGVRNDGHLNVEGGTMSDNRASTGGSLCNQGGVAVLLNTEITHNVGMGGGGIANFDGSLWIIRSTIANNSGDGAGGLLTTSGEVRISRSRFLSNGSLHFAGGMRVQSGTVWIDETTFEGNVADGAGAIYAVAQGGPTPSSPSLTAPSYTTAGPARVRSSHAARWTSGTRRSPTTRGLGLFPDRLPRRSPVPVFSHS